MKKWFALLLSALMLLSSAATAEEVYPIYRATPRTQQEANFFDKVDLEWFNQSGQAKYENTSRRARSDRFTSNDEAQLHISPEYINYTEYDGDYCMIARDTPKNPDGPFPRPSFASEIGTTASSVLWRFEEHSASGVKPALLKKELNGITLEQADAQVQSLLTNLGLSGYELLTAIDMDVNRIREWGVQQVAMHKTNWNTFDRYYDFGTATEADEGYYLIYTQTLNGLPVGIPDSAEDVRAFVNATGIVTFELRNSYAIGEVYDTPDKLLSEDDIRKVFEKDNDRRIADHFYEPTFVRATLKYAPMRATEKKDGMVMAPAWYIEYTFVDASSTENGWAWYSALDGKLIMDCYF